MEEESYPSIFTMKVVTTEHPIARRKANTYFIKMIISCNTCTTTSDVFKSTTFPTSVNPSLTWKDNPTITYEELTGVEYATQMLSPIPADTSTHGNAIGNFKRLNSFAYYSNIWLVNSNLQSISKDQQCQQFRHH